MTKMLAYLNPMVSTEMVVVRLSHRRTVVSAVLKLELETPPEQEKFQLLQQTVCY